MLKRKRHHPKSSVGTKSNPLPTDHGVPSLLDRTPVGSKAPTLQEKVQTFLTQQKTEGPQAQLRLVTEPQLAPELKDLFDPNHDCNAVSFKDRETLEIKPELLHLPGELEMEALKHQSDGGFQLQLYERPLLIGKPTNMLVDTTEWTEKANAIKNAVCPQLPDIPFNWFFMGAIGSGKTTVLFDVLRIYQFCFKEIIIISPTLQFEGNALDFMAKRNPKCNVILMDYDGITPSFVQSFKDRQVKKYAKYMAVAKEGLYTLPQDTPVKAKSVARLVAHLEPYSNRQQPYRNIYGERHGRPLHIHPVHDSKIGSTIIPRRKEGVRHSRQFKGGFGFQINHEPLAVPGEIVVDGKNHVRIDTLNRDQPSIPLPVNTNEHSIEHHILNSKILDPEHNLQAAQQDAIKTAHMYGEAEKLVEDQQIDGTLVVLEDAAFQQATRSQAYQQFTIAVRHYGCSQIVLTQVSKGVGRAVRVNATHLNLWCSHNDTELKLIQEEFGGTIPNFMGAYFAATAPIGEYTNHFLYINVRKHTASRCFLGELIPVGSEQKIEAISADTQDKSLKSKPRSGTKGVSHAQVPT